MEGLDYKCDDGKLRDNVGYNALTEYPCYLYMKIDLSDGVYSAGICADHGQHQQRHRDAASVYGD